MMLLINGPESIQRQVCIHLRGRNICVTEDRLHRTQVRSILHHVRGAGVPQHMRRRVAPGPGGRTHHLPQALPGKLAPAASHK